MQLSSLRQWDYVAAQRVDYFIANSKTVKRRIEKYYRRDSVVIYPPVETNSFYIEKNRPAEKYFLIGCRLAPYKRVDIVIEAFKKLGSDYRLKVFGDGVDLKRLKKIADLAPNIEFLGRVSDEERARLYASAEAFINPQEEDFGITVVESMASGRPVIAYGKGGATETVVDKETGTFFYEQNSEEIYQAVKNFQNDAFDPEKIKAWAEKFSVNNFQQRMKSFIAWAQNPQKEDKWPGDEII